jgi:OmpA-OmpF porin, OOP family
MECKELIPLILLFALSTPLAAQTSVAVEHTEAPDIRGINFKRLRPLARDSLAAAVDEPSDDSIKILQMDADVLKAYPKLRVDIVGFTDSEECEGHACIDLSLRRAKLVFAWLISHGVPKSQLSGPEGLGDAAPIDDNGRPVGRARNRRAELHALTYPNGKPYTFPSD